MERLDDYFEDLMEQVENMMEVSTATAWAKSIGFNEVLANSLWIQRRDLRKQVKKEMAGLSINEKQQYKADHKELIRLLDMGFPELLRTIIDKIENPTPSSPLSLAEQKIKLLKDIIHNQTIELQEVRNRLAELNKQLNPAEY